jgi:SAM-dependent methyltransferase
LPLFGSAQVRWYNGLVSGPPSAPAGMKRAYNMTEPTWKRYLTDYNEGLGLVYERFVLNDFLSALQQTHSVETVLEAPLFGMAGVSGINSVALAQAGARVTLVDDHPERLAAVARIWDELSLPVTCIQPGTWAQLPFPDESFDLAWNWAALWYLPDPGALLRELVRVSRRLVFVAMPNPRQVGYLLRKHLLERDFVNHVDERWTHIGRIEQVLEGTGLRLIDRGVLDVPPWPDTVMPASEVLQRLGIRSKKLQGQFSGDSWQWSTMAYYLGEQPDLYDRVIRYAWLDRAPIPWQLKVLWAHHRYVVGLKGR